jgi:dienelactone hydrolase
MLPTLFLSTALMTPAADPDPDAVKRADEAIHKYLAAEAAKLSQKFMDGAKTKAEWESKRPRLKQEFLDMLGLWPLPEKTPLKATVTGTLERGDVTIDKLHFQSRPGLYVTGNLYRPKGASGKLPAILYVCGHSGRGRDGNKTAFQDHGMWFASNGYVCLVIDTLQLGEVAGKHHGTYNLNRFWWQSRGYTPAGVECWNGIRAIDYLVSRPDVDPERIGVTGISGGGATTVWIAAADDRVKVAVPVSGMSDLESYVTNKVIDGHCDCMFFINTYQWEWTTALALHAPKPLLFANSDNDKIFPMDGNRRIIERMRKCYDLLGKKENVEEYVSKGGHDYRPDLRVAIFQFINKHLKQDMAPVKDADFPKIEGKDLRVFPEDKDLPKDQINDKVDEVFVQVAEVKLPAKAEEFKEWKAGLVKKLRERSFRPLPDRVPAARDRGGWVSGAYYLEPSTEGDLRVDLVARLNPGQKEFPSTQTMMLRGQEHTKVQETGRPPEWAARLGDVGRVYWELKPRGVYPDEWIRKSPPNYVERAHALLGRTVDQARVWDLAAIGHLLEDLVLEKEVNVVKGKRKLRMVAFGQTGVIAAYAALFEPSITEVVIVDPPTSHRDGPHFLNVDRVLDLPTALGLLAPDVKLTLINAKDKAFDKTAAIYKLAGAESKFKRE